MSGASAEGSVLEEIAAWAVAHCPVSEAMSRAVPVTVEAAVG
jgi:organic hydroperoxide reductase OsmC/OhrA